MDNVSDFDNEPNILFFRGVLPEKYNIDTMFTNKIMESLRVTESYELKDELDILTPFDKMPLEFSSNGTWPRRLNIQCWWCNRRNESTPIFIPNSVDVNGKMATYGMFDTFFCAAAFIDVFIDHKERWEKHEQLKLLYKKMTGVYVKYIPRSPRPFQMIHYGYGSETPDNYAKKLASLSMAMITYKSSPVFTHDDEHAQNADMDKHI